MWEEGVPPVVAPESLQAHEALVASLTPKLARPFEAALVLAAGGLNGSAAYGLPQHGGQEQQVRLFETLLQAPMSCFREHGP